LALTCSIMMNPKSSSPLVSSGDTADNTQPDTPTPDPKAPAVTTYTGPVLLPQHAARLVGIQPSLIAQRGYRSESNFEAVRSYFSDVDPVALRSEMPALMIPVWQLPHQPASEILQFAQPRVGGGFFLRYLMRPRLFEWDYDMCVDCHPAVWPQSSDPELPLVITDGLIEADLISSREVPGVALLAPGRWKGVAGCGGKTVLPGLMGHRLFHHDVFIAFGPEVSDNARLQKSEARLASFLATSSSRRPRVYLVRPPRGPFGGAFTLTEYFAADGTLSELLSTAQKIYG
jgi:hypothetical protein